MRVFPFMRAVAVCAAAVNGIWAAAGIAAPDASVGRNLQVPIAVRLPKANPEAGIKLTISSDDPARLLLSDAPDKAGAAKITITVLPRFVESPEFWLHGLTDSGAATYTVSAEGLESVKGKVTLTPSAVVIVGPLRAPRFPTTPHAEVARITLITAAVDAAGKIVQEQQVAGGTQVELGIANSNPSAGKLRAPKLLLKGGSSTAVTVFEPAGEGETTLSPIQPPGFKAAKEFATVIAAVAKPGLAIVGDVYLGKDLQIAGVLCLGEAAPPGGLEVTLTSADPSKLVLSPGRDLAGSGSVKIKVPAGQLTATYSIQGLGDSGEVTYEAAAPGFRSRVAKIGLTPSGVIVAYEPYGPPDEAMVLRKSQLVDERSFSASLADSKPIKLAVWTAHLDRETGRAADITVQALRPGVEAVVMLKSSDPTVATVESPLVIKIGDHAVSHFKPLKKGTTVITVETPKGFSTPKNAIRVPASVSD